MAKKEKGPITQVWLEARQLMQTGQLSKLEDKLDYGIWLVSRATLEGLRDKDLLENVKMEVWKERFWVAVENYIWKSYPDYEKNWKV